MLSPKSKKRPWASPRRPFKQGERKHLNKRFYNSKEWKTTREAYLNQLQRKVWDEAINHKWTIPGAELELTHDQSAYILSRDFLPCETCMKLFAVGAYDKLEEGKELDHIQPLNPENALETKGYGSPFDFNNLQFLCRRHHAKKSNREKKR